jgi:DNA gyrase/topoisomerase IV subunit B
MNGKTIEQTYVKVSQHQHILEKPGMYIGETKKVNDELWTYDDGKMLKKDISYSAGFMKIFDEILVNALDHSKRDSTVSAIKIDIVPEEGKISVYNNGEGIPVEQHPEHKKYIPELIFGDLLTSSNYDKDEERTWGGTNGLGAKCVSPETIIPTPGMYFKKASEIQPGDLLYGDKMQTVRVLNVSRGYGRMYRIKEENGDFYDVSENHLLTLKYIGPIYAYSYKMIAEQSTYVSETLFDISVKNFLELPIQDRRLLHGVRQYYDNAGPIQIKYLGNSDYVSITVDGNNRFLINDYTITHNCTNIYSTKFIVETADGKNSFHQVFTKNMYHRTLPLIKKSSKKFTKITFYPDFNRFEMQSLDKEIMTLMQKRVIDLVATTSKKVSIYLNDKKVEYKSFKDYISLFSGDAEIFTMNYVSPDGKYEWDIGVCPSDHYEQISFVNGICTTKGGKHVDLIVNSLVKRLVTDIETKKKQTVKASIIKDRMMVFLSCTIPNPSFSSQSKDELTTNSKYFGCKPELSDLFVSKIYKSQIVEEALAISNLKLDKELTKTDGKKKSRVYIPKLDDALWAGTSKSRECTLILTEGLSAMTFAMWGRSVLHKGNEKYGVFPLKGKLLNSKDATVSQLMNNEEINNLKQIIGLKQGKEYSDTTELRYGKVMILTDADSVTQDTPCVLKHKKTGEIEIKSINEINDGNNRWVVDSFSGKEYNTCSNYMVWSDQGWTDIVSVMRHKVSKPIYRVLTHTGCVDVTEDHSLLDKNNNEITVNNCNLETELMHKKITYEVPSKNKYNIDEEYAWALGYFQADGYCSTDSKVRLPKKDGTITDAKNYRWAITCIEKEPLEKLKSIFEKYIQPATNISTQIFSLNQCNTCYHVFNKKSNLIRHQKTVNCSATKQLEFRISEIKCNRDSYSLTSNRRFAYKLELYGDRKNTCIMFRNMFYNSSREKIVPKEILNNSLVVQQAFLNGFYAGDGCKAKGTKKFDGEYKSQMCGLFQLLQNCGYNPSLNCSSKKTNVYSILMGEKYNKPEYKIKKIINVSEKYQNTYVYDFETKNHHFHGGIGNMIVHNTDGCHIKSLFVNYIHTFWPSLLKLDFIQSLRTPIVVATKGKTRKEFYTEGDYIKWQKEENNNGWTTKYYKGLGTSNKEDAKNIFSRMEPLKIDYYYKDKKCNDSIILAFEKDKNNKQPQSHEVGKLSDQRKLWLQHYDKDIYIDSTTNKISFQDLIHKELIHFSIYDNMRSIPSMVDGLKPSQRKIMHYMLENGSTAKEIKVAQLSGYVSAETNYHHGEASLQQAIVNLAQNYVGTNNLNYLMPMGNFGSRIASNDSASPRYIFTKLSPYTPILFDSRDNPLLNYIIDDGDKIEPDFFVPIIPTVLLNGISGIGTGYSTFIPPHNPRDIVENIYKILDNKPPKEMIPYYRGFNGIVEKLEDGKYQSKGKFERINDTTIQITELPISTWITTYKEFLESMVDANKGDKTNRVLLLKDVINNTKDESTGIKFIVEFKHKDDLDRLIEKNVIEKELKLVKPFSTNNMYLFDNNSVPVKYNTTNDILLNFCQIRLEYYLLRKEYMLKQLKNHLRVLQSKIKFITEYMEGSIKIHRQDKERIYRQLEERKYHKIENSYDYLLTLPISSLSKEKLLDLQNIINNKTREYEILLTKDNKTLWREDLQNLEKYL